ncbi:MAG TPA: NAD-dependent epimerase/dehydratase family protein [Acidimicrobiales bacterium]|nr:NAD-dependent epimerase/dehydratase family protein [Acidimicrobiales bacterium]
MRAVVTGAAGFIGSRLCARLLADGHLVLGVDCLTDYYDPDVKMANLSALVDLPGARFEWCAADLSRDNVADLVDGAEVVFHLAGQPGVRPSWGDGFDAYLRHNLAATQRLLEALRTHPARLVFASSSSVYGEAQTLPVAESHPSAPISPYGMSKAACEQLVHMYAAYGVEAVTLRYFTVFGPGQRPDMAFHRFIGNALAGRSVEVLGDGAQSRDFTFVDDAVSATVAAASAPAGAVYNVGGGCRATVNDVIAVIADMVGGVPVARRERAAGDVRDTWADTTAARRDLGWRPTTDLATGLAAQVTWMRERLSPAVGPLAAAPA